MLINNATLVRRPCPCAQTCTRFWRIPDFQHFFAISCMPSLHADSVNLIPEKLTGQVLMWRRTGSRKAEWRAANAAVRELSGCCSDSDTLQHDMSRTTPIHSFHISPLCFLSFFSSFFFVYFRHREGPSSCLPLRTILVVKFFRTIFSSHPSS
jgi:hypothetical protein